MFLKLISKKKKIKLKIKTVGTICVWWSCEDVKKASTKKLHPSDVAANSICININKIHVHVLDQTAPCGRRKSNWVKTIPCSMCLCTVYFTGDEMSTMVYINLQNNIGKYSLTIWNCFTVRQKNYIEEMPSTLKDKIHSWHQVASTEPCQFTRAEDLPLKSFLHST